MMITSVSTRSGGGSTGAMLFILQFVLVIGFRMRRVICTNQWARTATPPPAPTGPQLLLRQRAASLFSQFANQPIGLERVDEPGLHPAARQTGSHERRMYRLSFG